MTRALRSAPRGGARSLTALATAGAVSAGLALVTALAIPIAPDAEGTASASPRSSAMVEQAGTDGRSVPLDAVVAGWPEAYTVTGTKSEPLYVEHITSTRDGDTFALRIDVVAQGDSPLGVQEGVVRVAVDGTIAWLSGCTKSAELCADDPSLRGFLAPAAVLAASRTGTLPASGTTRSLHGTPVVCVEPAALYPDAPTITDLAPCFSEATGALLGHWSVTDSAFVGPTLGPGLDEETRPDTALLDSLLS